MTNKNNISDLIISLFSFSHFVFLQISREPNIALKVYKVNLVLINERGIWYTTKNNKQIEVELK